MAEIKFRKIRDEDKYKVLRKIGNSLLGIIYLYEDYMWLYQQYEGDENNLQELEDIAEFMKELEKKV